MRPIATVVIPHAYTTRWTQIAVSSLKGHKNEASFDIIVIDNSPGHPSIRGISETELHNGVMIVTPPDPNMVGHQLALDMAIDYVKTPYYLAWETDVQVMRHGWLDYFLDHVKDEYTAIVGWYWSIGIDDSRHYISPAGALYNTRILKQLKKECLNNPDLACCYGRNMDKRIDFMKEYPHTAGTLIPQGIWGPFLESRGFGNVYPYAKERDHWVPEPGNWVYNRCVMQWECVHLPGGMVENEHSMETGIPHKYSFIGPSDSEAYLRHYFAGTVSHNFQKHKIPKHDAVKLPFWLIREHEIWNAVVPEEVKSKSIREGWVMSYEDEMRYAMSQVAPF